MPLLAVSRVASFETRDVVLESELNNVSAAYFQNIQRNVKILCEIVDTLTRI